MQRIPGKLLRLLLLLFTSILKGEVVAATVREGGYGAQHLQYRTAPKQQSISAAHQYNVQQQDIEKKVL